VYFRHPWVQEDEIVLEVPSDFKVEAIPAELKSSTPEKDATYEIGCEQTPKGLLVKRRFVIQSYVFQPERYASLREFFGKVQAGDEQHAVLESAVSRQPR
jgi:hypothetical protein